MFSLSEITKLNKHCRNRCSVGIHHLRPPFFSQFILLLEMNPESPISSPNRKESNLKTKVKMSLLWSDFTLRLCLTLSSVSSEHFVKRPLWHFQFVSTSIPCHQTDVIWQDTSFLNDTFIKQHWALTQVWYVIVCLWGSAQYCKDVTHFYFFYLIISLLIK